MNKFKNYIYTVIVVIILSFLIFRSISSSFIAEPFFKYLIYLFLSIPFFFFKLKIDEENYMIRLELIPIILLFLLFVNIYLSSFLLILLFLVLQIIRRMRKELLLKEVFIQAVTVIFAIILFGFFKNYFIFLTIAISYKKLLLFSLFIVFFKFALDTSFIVKTSALSRIFLKRIVISFALSYVLLILFLYGYIFFWEKTQIMGTFIYTVMFILTFSLIQIITKYNDTKKKYKLLLSMMGRVIEKSSLSEQLNEIIWAILQNYRVHFISIWLSDHDKKINTLEVCNPENLLVDKIESLPFGTGLIGKVVDNRKHIYIPDVTANPNYYEGVRGIRSELTIPLVYKNTVIGVIDLESNERGYFNNFLIELFNELSSQLSLIIYNSIANDKIKKQQFETSKILRSVQDLTVEVKDVYVNIELEINGINNKLNVFHEKNLSLTEKANEISVKELEIDENMKKINEKIEEKNAFSSNTSEKFVMTINVLKSMFELVNQSHDKVRSLLDNIENINVTLKKIQEISEKTNILSFNAAIEAARAGELGKGFAVVANNIKELVNKSESNINETTSIINTIKDLIVNLDSIFKTQYDTSTNAQKSINTLQGSIEKLINETNKDSSSFNNQLAEVKKTMSNLGSILNDISSSSHEFEEIKNKNNEIVNKANYLAEKLTTLESLTANLLEIIKIK